MHEEPLCLRKKVTRLRNGKDLKRHFSKKYELTHKLAKRWLDIIVRELNENHEDTASCPLGRLPPTHGKQLRPAETQRHWDRGAWLGARKRQQPLGENLSGRQSSARTSHVTLRPLQGAYAKANGLEQKPPKCPSTDGWSNTGAAHVGTSSALQRNKVLTPYMDDEPRKYHAKSSKPDTKGHTLYGSIYVRDSK